MNEKVETDLCILERQMEMFATVINHLLAQSLVQEAPAEQLTIVQMKLLRFILHKQKVSIGEIAKGLNFSYPAATKAVSRLEEKGLLIRESDPIDRRATIVSISAKGKCLLSKLSPARSKCLRDALGKLSDDEISLMQNGIRSFLSVAGLSPELAEQLCLHCGLEHREDCIIPFLKDICVKHES